MLFVLYAHFAATHRLFPFSPRVCEKTTGTVYTLCILCPAAVNTHHSTKCVTKPQLKIIHSKCNIYSCLKSPRLKTVMLSCFRKLLWKSNFIFATCFERLTSLQQMGLALSVGDRKGKSESIERQTNALFVLQNKMFLQRFRPNVGLFVYLCNMSFERSQRHPQFV